MTELAGKGKPAKNRRGRALRKILISFIVTLTIVVGGAFITQRVVIPKFIAKSLRPNTEPSKLIPERVRPNVIKARDELESHVDYMPKMLDSLQMTFPELVTIVDNMDHGHIANAIYELKGTELTSIDQVFTIVVKNVPVEGYDLEVFRHAFRERVSLSKVKRVLAKFDSSATTVLLVPIVTQTMKQLLHDNRAEIEATLERQ